MNVSRETRLSSRSAIGIKAAATRNRARDARFARLEQAVRLLVARARLYRISDVDRVQLRADLREALAPVELVLPKPDTEPT